jgi:hypothetical protein
VLRKQRVLEKLELLNYKTFCKNKSDLFGRFFIL